jgi:hypothetical protein
MVLLLKINNEQIRYHIFNVKKLKRSGGQKGVKCKNKYGIKFKMIPARGKYKQVFNSIKNTLELF